MSFSSFSISLSASFVWDFELPEKSLRKRQRRCRRPENADFGSTRLFVTPCLNRAVTLHLPPKSDRIFVEIAEKWFLLSLHFLVRELVAFRLLDRGPTPGFPAILRWSVPLSLTQIDCTPTHVWSHTRSVYLTNGESSPLARWFDHSLTIFVSEQNESPTKIEKKKESGPKL